MDGNKRTAFAAADVFLILNGSRIIATTDEIVELMFRVALDELDVDGIALWMRAHVANV